MEDAALRHLPNSLQSASVVRAYNALTGAALTHYEFDRLDIFTRGEILFLADNLDLVI